MHIIIGGAFNGKRRYLTELLVKEQVQMIQLKYLLESEVTDGEIIVIEQVEEYVEMHLTETSDEIDLAQKIFKEIMKQTAKVTACYIILQDIGRGIVPLDAKLRLLRDVQGRLNQLLFEQAQQITRIWYGIPQKIK